MRSYYKAVLAACCMFSMSSCTPTAPIDVVVVVPESYRGRILVVQDGKLGSELMGNAIRIEVNANGVGFIKRWEYLTRSHLVSVVTTSGRTLFSGSHIVVDEPEMHQAPIEKDQLFRLGQRNNEKSLMFFGKESEYQAFLKDNAEDATMWEWEP